MGSPPADLRHLAYRVVAHEAGGSSDAASTAAAVETACRRLDEELRRMLGQHGMFALEGRALHLARREHRLLASVTQELDGSSTFVKLAEALTTGTNEEAAAAGAAILAHLLDLLVHLLGPELGSQPVRKLWPDVDLSSGEIDA